MTGFDFGSGLDGNYEDPLPKNARMPLMRLDLVDGVDTVEGVGMVDGVSLSDCQPTAPVAREHASA